MLIFKKFLAIILLTLVIFTSPVLATDNALVDDTQSTENDVSVSETTSSSKLAETINNDLLVNNDDSYSINGILDGNAFISTDSLTIDSRNNGGIIFGNLFASTVDTTIKSDVVYSDTKDKIGNYLIDTTNSYSIINGNVYVLASNTFTLESKCEIHGDLYVYANVVNIEADAVVNGNVFIFANSTLNLNGKVSGSVYASTANYNMNYTGYISKDLLLNTENATISGKINRYAKINSDTGKITTTSDFIITKDFQIKADELQFAGEVQGNAVISARALTFDDSKNCIIRGNLNYATQSEITIPESIVLGEISSSEYVDTDSVLYTILEKVISYVGLLIYVFVVGLMLKRIMPNFMEKMSNITTSNILIGLGIGLGLFILLFPFLVLLLFTKFTIALALVLLASVLFIASIATPMFIVAIADAWQVNKLNIYVKMLIITSILFVVSLLSYFGITAIAVFVTIAIGKILIALFEKN